MGVVNGKESSSSSSSEEEQDNANPRLKEYTAQWQQLQMEQSKRAESFKESNYAASLKKENLDKNRYTGILAVESTRVKLPKLGGDPNSDYINGNYVSGIHEDSEKLYVATQGPLPGTFYDFWRMIWRYHMPVVIMLTRLEEGPTKKIKAHQYWPVRVEKSYGDITVTLDSKETHSSGEWKTRHFTIEKNGKTRKVIQYHYVGWPDHGVPGDPSSLLTMMEEVDGYVDKLLAKRRARDKAAKPRPYVVHCSAGIGRTGTYILINTFLKKLRAETNPDLKNLNLKEALSNIRAQRANSITQREQFLFCYYAIKYAMQDGVVTDFKFPFEKKAPIVPKALATTSSSSSEPSESSTMSSESSAQDRNGIHPGAETSLALTNQSNSSVDAVTVSDSTASASWAEGDVGEEPIDWAREGGSKSTSKSDEFVTAESISSAKDGSKSAKSSDKSDSIGKADKTSDKADKTSDKAKSDKPKSEKKPSRKKMRGEVKAKGGDGQSKAQAKTKPPKISINSSEPSKSSPKSKSSRSNIKSPKKSKSSKSLSSEVRGTPKKKRTKDKPSKADKKAAKKKDKSSRKKRVKATTTDVEGEKNLRSSR